MNKYVRIALVAGAMALDLSPAMARVCTGDWRPGTCLPVGTCLVRVDVARPSTVDFKYFGRWDEIVIYNAGESQILYQGPPINSFNVADTIIVLAFKFAPGALLQITADWGALSGRAPC